MRKAKILLIGLSAASTVAVAFFLTSTARPTDPLLNVDLVERMQECVDLQDAARTGDISEPAFLCATEVFRSAIHTGRYPTLLANKNIYAKPSLWGTCHAVGHSLGPELVEEGMAPREVFEAMFREKQSSVDHFCAAALIHGIIDGVSAGMEEEGLDWLAQQCSAANFFHNYYGTECAHYFGHAVWDVYQAISIEAAEACRMLDVYQVEAGMESCLGGVSMEKFGLQDAAYGPERSESPRRIPEIPEITIMCVELEEADERVRDGCWGGAGWLLSMILQRDMSRLDPAGEFYDFPDDLREEALTLHLDLLGACRTQNCMNTLLQHVRPQEWTNGIGEDICRLPHVPGREDLDLKFACDGSITSGMFSS